MLIKNRLLLCVLILMSVFSSKEAHAQYIADRMAIHFSNPLGLVTKGGFKLEYRFGQQNSALLNYNRYWGFFPGYNGGIEYHRYYQTWGNFENFIYGKVGLGFAEYRPQPYYSGWETEYVQPGKYFYGGAGVGRRYHWGPFFIELNLGLKAVQLIDKPKGDYNQNLFYSIGPGSLIDFNLHFGFQFLHYKGSVSHITGTQRWRRYNY